MKVAIVHYWLVTWRGGEKVLEQILNLYPDADIYTHTYDEEIIRKYLPGRNVKTTFISSLPNSNKYYQKYVAFMPYALEQLDLSQYDLVISTESGPAKNVVTNPDATHICYCHSPMRYVWDMYHIYQAKTGLFTRVLMKPLIHYLKMVDSLSANRVDHFIANSNFISKRINKCYRRDSEVIHPPVAVDEFELCAEKDEYYLYLGQLTIYKKADLALSAFIKNGRRLVVIGEGELECEFTNTPQNIEYLGKRSFGELKKYLSKAKALIFPGVEDFGIVPIEAIASGTPVVAYAKGGVLDSVIDGENGIYFHEQTVESLNCAIDKLDSIYGQFDVDIMRRHAEKYSEKEFKNKFKKFVDKKLELNGK